MSVMLQKLYTRRQYIRCVHLPFTFVIKKFRYIENLLIIVEFHPRRILSVSERFVNIDPSEQAERQIDRHNSQKKLKYFFLVQVPYISTFMLSILNYKHTIKFHFFVNITILCQASLTQVHSNVFMLIVALSRIEPSGLHLEEPLSYRQLHRLMMESIKEAMIKQQCKNLE